MERREVHKAMELAEEEYYTNRRRLENQMEEVQGERNDFRQYLDRASNKIRYTQQTLGQQHPVDARKIYNIIENANQEGEQIIRHEIRKIDSELEENQKQYRKKQNNYEDELRAIKRKEGY